MTNSIIQRARPALRRLTHWVRTEAVLVAILLFALATRLWHLGTFPANLVCDECDNLRNIYEIIVFDDPSLFGLDWKPQAALSLHMMSWFIRWGGNSPFMLRLPSALISVVALIPFYYLMRRSVSRTASLAAVLLLSTNPWYLNFSRSGWENVHICLATFLAVLGLIRALEGRGRWWVNVLVSSVGTAWSLYGYFAGRAVPFILALSLPFAFWLYPTRKRRILGTYAAITVLSLVLFAPQMPVIYDQWDAFTSRMRTVSALHVPLPSKDHESRVELLKDNLISAILSVTWPINNTRRYAAPAQPLIHPLVGLLAELGMFTSLWVLRRHIWWWLMLVVPLICTQVLTTQIPHAARGIAIAPILFYFAAVGLDVLSPYWYGFSQRRVAIVVVLLCMIAVYGDLRLYHEWMAAPETLLNRGPGVSVADFPYWAQWQINRLQKSGLKTGSMESWEKNRQQIISWIAANPERQAELAPATKGRLRLLRPLPVAQQPSADEKLASAGVGPEATPVAPQIWPAEIPKEELAVRLRQIANTPPPIREARQGAFDSTNGQGVEVTYYDGRNWFGLPTDQGWATDLTLRAVPQREVSIRWRATLTAPQSGSYRFALLSDDGAELQIDGKVVVTDLASHAMRAAASVFDLTAGEHPLELRYWQGGGMFAMVLLWQPPGEDWGPIPAAVLAAPKQ